MYTSSSHPTSRQSLRIDSELIFFLVYEVLPPELRVFARDFRLTRPRPDRALLMTALACTQDSLYRGFDSQHQLKPSSSGDSPCGGRVQHQVQLRSMLDDFDEDLATNGKRKLSSVY
jgi:hypothetical protein